MRGHQKDTEKAFDRMGGEHAGRIGLRGCGIAGILGQGIKVHQVAAGAVDKEAKQLLENLADRLALAAAAQGTEKGLQLGENPDVTQITDKEAQAAPAGQRVGGDLHRVDDGACFLLPTW